MNRYLLLILLFSSTLTSCVQMSGSFSNDGKGPIVDRTFESFRFCQIKLENGIESEVIRSEKNKVVVHAPDDIIDNILVENSDSNRIYIHLKKNANISTKKVKITIYTPTVCSLDASSASIILLKDSFVNDEISLETTSGAEVKGKLSALKINIKSSSGSNMDIQVGAKEATIKSTSGSSVDIRGFCKTATVGTSSGASIDAQKFYVSESILESTSGGSIDISTTHKVDAKASSGSSIDIHRASNELQITKHATSGGSVNIK